MKYLTLLLIFSATLLTTLAKDRWPGFWCDKECTETVLFANACKETKETSEDIVDCICSSHFYRKLNKCQHDGCDENYVNKNWTLTVEPLLEDCGDRYHVGPL